MRLALPAAAAAATAAQWRWQRTSSDKVGAAAVATELPEPTEPAESVATFGIGKVIAALSNDTAEQIMVMAAEHAGKKRKVDRDDVIGR